jgi:Fe2+ or Zn2+ uptake regulation protein
VIAAINSEAPINATAVASSLDRGVDAVYRELDLLESIGLLRRIKSERATTDFEITDAVAWRALGELCERGQLGKVIPP